MAQQNLNAPPFRAPFTTGDSSELGDTPRDLVNKIQANEAELYGKALAAAKFTTNAAVGSTTAAAGDLTGAASTVANYTALGTATLTTRTAAQMFADMNAVVGQTYEVGIMNNGGGGVVTFAGGTGVTIPAGGTSIANNAVRWYAVTFNSATTMTFQNIGAGSV